MTIESPPYVLLYAFRYALNRTTSASSDISREVIKNWDALGEEFQRQVVEDIKKQERRGIYPLNLEEAHWLRLAHPDWKRVLEHAKKKEQEDGS